MPDPRPQSGKVSDFWDRIDSESDAVESSNLAAYACFFCAAGTTAFAIYSLVEGSSIRGVTGWSLVDAAIFVLLGVWVRRRSPVGAIVATIFYAFEKGYQIYSGHWSGVGGVLVFFLLLALANGIRANFAYHRFRGAAPSSGAGV